MERWDRTRAGDLFALAEAALPDEGLVEDDLLACLWEDDDPAVVLAEPGVGAAAAVVRKVEDRRAGFVQLVAVVPDARRRGHGRRLLAAVEEWAFGEQLAVSLHVGGAAPFYLWPGVDVHATPALCFFEALGYVASGSQLNMRFPSRHRASPPAGVVLRRALEEADISAGLAFVGRGWPNWVAEARRAVEHGSCHLAFAAGPGAGTAAGAGAGGGPDDVGPGSVVRPGAVVGFGCHSVNRLGWLGPMGTDPERRHAGVGNALLGAIATDLMAAGIDTVEVAWVGPLGFYADAAGATVSRAFRTYGLSRRARGASTA